MLAAQAVAPAIANANAVWRQAWDKPLFANAKVAIGVAATTKPERYMPRAWQSWGVPGGDFIIEKAGKGTGVGAFHAAGPFAQRICAETGIALHRLYAIQGAAAAVRARAAASATPSGDLITTDAAAAVQTFSASWAPAGATSPCCTS